MSGSRQAARWKALELLNAASAILLECDDATLRVQHIAAEISCCWKHVRDMDAGDQSIHPGANERLPLLTEAERCAVLELIEEKVDELAGAKNLTPEQDQWYLNFVNAVEILRQQGVANGPRR